MLKYFPSSVNFILELRLLFLANWPFQRSLILHTYSPENFTLSLSFYWSLSSNLRSYMFFCFIWHLYLMTQSKYLIWVLLFGFWLVFGFFPHCMPDSDFCTKRILSYLCLPKATCCCSWLLCRPDCCHLVTWMLPLNTKQPSTFFDVKSGTSGKVC